MRRYLGKKAAHVALAASLALSGIALVGVPAQANDGTCGGSDFCLWQNSSQGGGRWDIFGSDMDYSNGDRWWGTTTSINDQASSVQNRHSSAMALCEHSFGRGAYVTVGGGMTINYLSDYEFDDKASSNYW